MQLHLERLQGAASKRKTGLSSARLAEAMG